MLLGLVVCGGGGGLPRLGDPGRSPRPASCLWKAGLVHSTEGCYVYLAGSASKLTVHTGTCKRIGTTDRKVHALQVRERPLSLFCLFHGSHLML